MKEFIFIYLYFVLKNIQSIGNLLFGLSLIILGVLGLFALFTYDDDDFDHIRAWSKRGAKWVIIIWVPFLFISSAVPTTDQMKWIIGGGMALKATQIDGVEDLPKNVVSAMNEFLEEVKNTSAE